MQILGRFLVGCVLLLGGATSSGAQTLRDRVKELFEVDFLQGLQTPLPAGDSSATIGDLLGATISSFPLPTSSSGFTYTFDKAVGARTRNSQTFGPMFVERPATIGRKNIGAGFSHQYVSYDTLGGHDLGTDQTL